jgi:hypothetical protein
VIITRRNLGNLGGIVMLGAVRTLARRRACTEILSAMPVTDACKSAALSDRTGLYGNQLVARQEHVEYRRNQCSSCGGRQRSSFAYFHTGEKSHPNSFRSPDRYT